MENVNENIEQKVIKVFEKYCNRDISLDDSINSLELDSLDFVKLIIELEDTFNIEMDDDMLYVGKGICVNDFCIFLKKSSSI